MKKNCSIWPSPSWPTDKSDTMVCAIVPMIPQAIDSEAKFLELPGRNCKNFIHRDNKLPGEFHIAVQGENFFESNWFLELSLSIAKISFTEISSRPSCDKHGPQNPHGLIKLGFRNLDSWKSCSWLPNMLKKNPISLKMFSPRTNPCMRRQNLTMQMMAMIRMKISW